MHLIMRLSAICFSITLFSACSTARPVHTHVEPVELLVFDVCQDPMSNFTFDEAQVFESRMQEYDNPTVRAALGLSLVERTALMLRQAIDPETGQSTFSAEVLLRALKQYSIVIEYAPRESNASISAQLNTLHLYCIAGCTHRALLIDDGMNRYDISGLLQTRTQLLYFCFEGYEGQLPDDSAPTESDTT